MGSTGSVKKMVKKKSRLKDWFAQWLCWKKKAGSDVDAEVVLSKTQVLECSSEKNRNLADDRSVKATSKD